jgi:hypothetical protein
VRGTVYLTDGLERLDLPGRECVFALEHDWVIRGQACSWTLSHEEVATVAGAEVLLQGYERGLYVVTIDVGELDGSSKVVSQGNLINFTPSVMIAFDRIREAT